MVDTDSQTPGATPSISGDFSMASIDGSSDSVTRSYPDDSDEHGEPPARRVTNLSSDCGYALHRTCKPLLFLSLCPVMGVLICMFVLCPLLPQVRNPAPISTGPVPL